MRIEFTKASRKHRIGRASVRYVMTRTTPTEWTTARGEDGWRYIGTDERGRELEIVAVDTDHDAVLVIHVMPTALRRKDN